jgi:hypothetical protein
VQLTPIDIPPGELSAAKARELTDLLRSLTRLVQLSVTAPLEASQSEAGTLLRLDDSGFLTPGGGVNVTPKRDFYSLYKYGSSFQTIATGVTAAITFSNFTALGEDIDPVYSPDPGSPPYTGITMTLAGSPKIMLVGLSAVIQAANAGYVDVLIGAGSWVYGQTIYVSQALTNWRVCLAAPMYLDTTRTLTNSLVNHTAGNVFVFEDTATFTYTSMFASRLMTAA